MQAIRVAVVEHHPDHPRLLAYEEDTDLAPDIKTISAQIQRRQSFQKNHPALVVGFMLRVQIAPGN